MGVFDTMSGYANCPACNEINRVEIQFKWLDPCMSYFEIGEYISGNQPYHVLDRDTSFCYTCHTSYNVHAIGHFGVLYGFVNEKQLDACKPFLSGPDKSAKIISLAIDPALLDNPEEIVERFRTQFLADASKESYYIGDNEGDISSHVCRYPSALKKDAKRFDVGDEVFFDNTRRLQYWEGRNTKYTITHRTLEEETQLFSYTLSSGSEVREGVSEKYVISQGKRDEKVAEIDSYIKALVEYEKNPTQEMKRKLALRLGFHRDILIQQLKDMGTLSADFTL